MISTCRETYVYTSILLNCHLVKKWYSSYIYTFLRIGKHKKKILHDLSENIYAVHVPNVMITIRKNHIPYLVFIIFIYS